MGYTVLSGFLLLLIYLVKQRLPKSAITLEYFKGDLSLLDEDEIPTY